MSFRANSEHDIRASRSNGLTGLRTAIEVGFNSQMSLQRRADIGAYHPTQRQYVVTPTELHHFFEFFDPLFYDSNVEHKYTGERTLKVTYGTGDPTTFKEIDTSPDKKTVLHGDKDTGFKIEFQNCNKGPMGPAQASTRLLDLLPISETINILNYRVPRDSRVDYIKKPAFTYGALRPYERPVYKFKDDYAYTLITYEPQSTELQKFATLTCTANQEKDILISVYGTGYGVKEFSYTIEVGNIMDGTLVIQTEEYPEQLKKLNIETRKIVCTNQAPNQAPKRPRE